MKDIGIETHNINSISNDNSNYLVSFIFNFLGDKFTKMRYVTLLNKQILHTYVCISGGKYFFFGNFGVLCLLVTLVLRFAFLSTIYCFVASTYASEP